MRGGQHHAVGRIHGCRMGMGGALRPPRRIRKTGDPGCDVKLEALTLGDPAVVANDSLHGFAECAAGHRQKAHRIDCGGLHLLDVADAEQGVVKHLGDGFDDVVVARHRNTLFGFAQRGKVKGRS